MKAKKLFKSVFYATVALTFFACGDDEEIKPNGKTEEKANHQIALVHEGSWGGNNACIHLYNASKKTLTSPIEWEGIGDVANDAIMGTDGKIYAALSMSQRLGVASYETVQDNNLYSTDIRYNNFRLPHTPRSLVECDGSIYISCQGGYLIRFDLKSREQEEIKLEGGDNLEGIAEMNGTLYICNSYSVDENYTYTYNRDILTYDTKKHQQGQTLQSVVNPNYLCTIGDHLFVLGFGDYAAEPYQIAEIDTQTGKSTPIAEGSKMGIWKGELVFCQSQTDWSTNTTSNEFYTYNPENKKTTPVDTSKWPSELSNTAIYAIQGDSQNDDLYIATTDYTTTSSVYRFGKDGVLIDSFDSEGINCNKILPLKQ